MRATASKGDKLIKEIIANLIKTIAELS
jgi:hypothetical protein